MKKAALAALCLALCLAGCGGGGPEIVEPADGPVTESGSRTGTEEQTQTPGEADGQEEESPDGGTDGQDGTAPGGEADAQPIFQDKTEETGENGQKTEPGGQEAEQSGTVTPGGVRIEDPVPSDSVLSQTVTAHNHELYSDAWPDGAFEAESHVILAVSQKDTAEGYAVTVYLASLYQAYIFPDGEPEILSGASMPLALTFLRTADGFRLTEYWEPEDGGEYWPSLREKFPASLPDEDLDMQTYIGTLMADCEAQAASYARNQG